MDDVFEYKIGKCPYYEKASRMPSPCRGELEFLGNEQTLMGTFWGIDSNDNREFFRCKKCKRKFKRNWKWEVA